MEWMNPSGAWALLALVPVVVLYVLKPKTKRQKVPSLLLWRKMETETPRRNPFQRLQNQLLLWLQVAMVCLLAACLSRPVSSGAPRGEAVFVFDLSLSMQTTDAQGVSRLSRAKEAAFEVLSGMRATDAVTVLAAGKPFQQVLSRSGDHASARRAIEGLKAQNGQGDLAGALALANALRRDIQGLRVYVFTDDASVSSSGASLCAVGQPMENRCLLDASIQPEAERAFVRVKNVGAACEATLECYADGALCDVRTVALEPDGESGVRFVIPKNSQSVMVRLSDSDALMADNVRYAVREARLARTALLVTEGNVFVQSALRLDEQLIVDLASPEDANPSASYDLYVYDGCLPESLPEGGAVLAIHPPRGVGEIEVSEDAPVLALLRAASSETAQTIAENLLLSDIAVQSAQTLTGGTAVLTAGNSSLLSVQEQEGRRIAVLGFDVHKSNLPLKADFPVLVQNLLSYLLPDAVASVESAACGEAVLIHSDARSMETFVTTPSGRRVSLTGGRLEETDEIGEYTLVERFEQGSERQTPFVLHPPEDETDTMTVAVSAASNDAEEAVGGSREWTPWLLLALLAITLLEWRVSRRGA